ncbi:MAG TPA: DUF2141 domain-containing protein [Cyclobacteriaceae bacterium]|nr:DUF2141 domain-containing protein [Cyclobacteriaceae bacterium]
MRWIWIVISFFGSPAMAQDIHVEISKIRHREGELVVAIFDNQKSFLKKPFRVVRLQPAGDKVETIITGVAPGTYAISVFHDRNQNDILDSNVLGIPQEGFGFSRNVMGFFGPPSFQSARFDVENTDVTLAITLRHY